MAALGLGKPAATAADAASAGAAGGNGGQVVDLLPYIDFESSQVLNFKSEGGDYLRDVHSIFSNSEESDRVLLSDCDAEIIVNVAFKVSGLGQKER